MAAAGRTRALGLTALVTVALVLGVAPVSAAPISSPAAATGPAPAAAALDGGLQQAVADGAEVAEDEQGATAHVVVIDRLTGDVLARTDNADEQVASESVVKTLLAAYYLVRYRGNLPADVSSDLHEMIVNSDDDMCSAYWTDDAVPTIAARYGLQNTEVNPDNPGRWGATRITAADMATFLYEMSRDPEVGPWLTEAMQDTADLGLDGYDQNFGFNALAGAASKQGWGSDNWTDEPNAVHSVGLTDRYAAAVLITGPSGTYRTMGSLVSGVVDRIMAAPTPPLPDLAPLTAPTAPRQAAGTGHWWSQALVF